MVDEVAEQYIFPPTADFRQNVPHRTSAQLVTLTLVSMFLSVRNWLIPNRINGSDLGGVCLCVCVCGWGVVCACT